MSEVVVRRETPADFGGVRLVNVEAFETPIEAQLVDSLRSLLGAISIVATIGDRVVGHTLFTPVALGDDGVVRVSGLGPMAVHPEYQRQGIGQALVRAGLAECRKWGYSGVVVVGHPNYYPRFGFAPAETNALTCEFDVPPEAFMALELSPGGFGRGGVIRYHPQFALASAE